MYVQLQINQVHFDELKITCRHPIHQISNEERKIIATAIQNFYDRYKKTIAHHLDIPVQFSTLNTQNEGQVHKLILGKENAIHIAFGHSEPTEEVWKNAEQLILGFRKALGVTDKYFQS